ncbi:hypothetical protein KIPB_005698 [Kipferlia bialata]|uniref:Uncharacterized protein n=1 Tax=Kipferlia bialata TaxID=797122 RepID=A0A9K3CVT1_9EUKA|nr:hypothetical protein KIPB_005698 [Kipferlia bialata]|eukprot:g5698.t1
MNPDHTPGVTDTRPFIIPLDHYGLGMGRVRSDAENAMALKKLLPELAAQYCKRLGVHATVRNTNMVMRRKDFLILTHHAQFTQDCIIVPFQPQPTVKRHAEGAAYKPLRLQPDPVEEKSVFNAGAISPDELWERYILVMTDDQPLAPRKPQYKSQAVMQDLDSALGVDRARRARAEAKLQRQAAKKKAAAKAAAKKAGKEFDEEESKEALGDTPDLDVSDEDMPEGTRPNRDVAKGRPGDEVQCDSQMRMSLRVSGNDALRYLEGMAKLVASGRFDVGLTSEKEREQWITLF